MPEKTYVTNKKSLALAWPGNHVDLHFTNGKLVTAVKEEQDFIESLPSFKDDTITLEAPADLLAEAVAKAGVLREAADKAEAEAKAAEKVVADLSPKAAAKEPKPAKDPK